MAEITPRWLLVTLVLLFVLTVIFFVFLAYVLGPEARLDTTGSAAALFELPGTGLAGLRAV
ncbi:hypothetical protein [Rhodothermus profundi]|uniref:Uncharacterized protein n=1 Tax=Rhodothermus profundi TaxID=633813 RepID=A0A1M6QC29_9BACT|nr:hypothetical protein [Rhodothermus profundi]SHK17864.1 hypothetical protein SAMN04488087_0561 [Rhodothermus profundi]